MTEPRQEPGKLGDNPRYAAYAIAHGRTPEAQLAHDKERLPSACMMEFVFWNRDHLTRFLRLTNHGWPMLSRDSHNEAYNRWLHWEALRERTIWLQGWDMGPAEIPTLEG